MYLQKHRPDIKFEVRGGFLATNVLDEDARPTSRIICVDGSEIFHKTFEEFKSAINVFGKYIAGKYSRRRTLERTSLIKDELIEKSWHPDRFSAWYLDEDQKKTIDQRFE